MAMMPYPVSYSVERPERYNRLAVLFRIILLIPQYIIFGGIPFYLLAAGSHDAGFRSFLQLLSEINLTTAFLIIIVIAWFAILITTRFPVMLLRAALFLFRWQQNITAYSYLLTDPYPPFGDGPYPLTIQVIPTQQHSRLTTFFRFILVIPHVIVLWFLGIAMAVVTFLAWFAIVFTGTYPASMYEFAVGVARWGARVAAYMALFVDEYPPFSLSDETRLTGLQPETA